MFKLTAIAEEVSRELTFFVGQGKQLAQMLDEDPQVMERREACARRLELYKSARDEIDAVAWAKWPYRP